MTDAPESVRIGGFRFKIVWKDGNWALGNRREAEISYIDCELRFHEGASLQQIAASFIHEVAHGIDWYHDYCKHPERDEAVANVCGYGLLSFWRNNPKAWVWYRGMIDSLIEEDSK